MVRVVCTAFSIRAGRLRRLPKSIINHIASIAWPGLRCLPSKVSDKLPSVFTFSTTIPPSSGRKNTSITSWMQASIASSINEGSKSGSISRAKLHNIIGRAKFLSERVPGWALLHLPLGLSCLERIISKVFLAISAYSLLPVAMLSWPKAIVAKV